MDARALKTLQKHAKTSGLDRLYGENRVNYIFYGKDGKNIVKNNVLEGFLVYMSLNWPEALEHGKIEENNVNGRIFKGLGK